MEQVGTKLETRLKKVFVGICLLYAIITHFLVALHLSNQSFPVGVAVITMALTLILTWVFIGGILQLQFLQKYHRQLTTPTTSPVLYFTLFATALACLEEIITVSITNLAPLYGVKVGEAYITASTNYFDVIFLHSVIVFVPMIITLGLILKRYEISPFKALLMWGTVGVIGEASFGGTQAFLTAPSWIFIYGLMVYVPSYIFINTTRKKPSIFLYPFFIVIILVSAISVVWIPQVLNHPSIHFQPITLTQ